MFEDLAEASLKLSELLDEIEEQARGAMACASGLHRRQYVTVIERVRIARAAVGDQLSILMREVKALEVKVP
jgi:phage-related minor tail protein